jgi:hypothetical protein
MELAPNLLGPDAGGVREQREVGTGLARLGGLDGCGGRGRMMLGHGDLLLD